MSLAYRQHRLIAGIRVSEPLLPDPLAGKLIGDARDAGLPPPSPKASRLMFHLLSYSAFVHGLTRMHDIPPYQPIATHDGAAIIPAWMLLPWVDEAGLCSRIREHDKATTDHENQVLANGEELDSIRPTRETLLLRFVKPDGMCHHLSVFGPLWHCTSHGGRHKYRRVYIHHFGTSEETAQSIYYSADGERVGTWDEMNAMNTEFRDPPEFDPEDADGE